uniref:Uncharacterized protein n=1 Tax=Ditylenchus dipsaci TaxID=166011 RepID=A0A915EET6_9BILA
MKFARAIQVVAVVSVFTERYTEFLKNTTDMTSISTDDSFSPEIPSSISPSLNLSTEDEEGNILGRGKSICRHQEFKF